MDVRVEAIRANKRVGNGSCTTIDEAFTDAELIKALDEDGITTPAQAVEWAIDVEGLHREQALNTRWGEDNDPELKSYRDWEAGND